MNSECQSEPHDIYTAKFGQSLCRLGNQYSRDFIDALMAALTFAAKNGSQFAYLNQIGHN